MFNIYIYRDKTQFQVSERGWADKRGILAVITGGPDDLCDVSGRITILFSTYHMKFVYYVKLCMKSGHYCKTLQLQCDSAALTKQNDVITFESSDVIGHIGCWSTLQQSFSLALHSEKRVPESQYLLQKYFSVLRNFKSRFLDNIDMYVPLIGNIWWRICPHII